MIPTTDAAQRTDAEVRQIARTLATLGTATGKQLADATGLSVALVTRRLKAGSFSRCAQSNRIFAVVERPDYRTRALAVWGLTSFGTRLVMEAV